MNKSYSVPEIMADIGKRLRRLRVQRDLDQNELAERSGLSRRSIYQLENGKGSTLETLIRYLRALDYLEGIEHLAPKQVISPVAMLRQSKAEPVRVVHRRKRSS